MEYTVALSRRQHGLVCVTKSTMVRFEHSDRDVDMSHA